MPQVRAGSIEFRWQGGITDVQEHAPELAGQHAAERQAIQKPILVEPADLRRFRLCRRSPSCDVANEEELAAEDTSGIR